MINVAAITLYGENMYEAKITASDLKEFMVLGIHSSLHLDVEGIKETVRCEGLVAVIKHEANAILEAPFARYGTYFNLLDNDHCLTQFDIEYEDGSNVTCYLPYDDDDISDDNILMETHISNDGDLYITVGDGLHIEDII